MLDNEGRCLETNSTCLEMLGYRRKELVGKSLLELCIEGESARALLSPDSSPARFRDQAFNLLHADGREVLTTWSGHSVPPGLLITIREVTATPDKEELANPRLQKAVIEAVGGVCIVDNLAPERPIIFVNETFSEITGYSPEEVLGRNCRFLQGPEREQVAVRTLSEALAKGQAARVTLRNFRKDGTPFWNELQVTPVRNEQGTVTHFIGFQLDVSEQYETRIALEQSRRLLEKTQELGNIGAWEYSREEGQFWSPEVFRIHGLQPGSSPPPVDKCIEFFSESSRSVVEQAFNRCLEYGEPYDLVLRMITARGEERWVRTVGEPAGGQVPPTKLQGSLQDITDAVETSLALRGSEYRFRKAFDNAPHGMAIMRVDGQLLNVNASLCRILGASREELLQESLCTITDESDREICKNLMGRVVSGELPNLQLEIRLLHNQQHQVPVALSAAVVSDFSGKAEHLVAHILDLTIQKRLEEEQKAHSARRRQAQKLESLGLLAGGIAHDFNNLLTSILGNVELALMEMPPSGMARDCLKDVITTTQRAAELCNQMLAYAGKGKFLVQPTNLSELVWEMCRLLSPKIPSSVSTRYLLAENLPLVDADATQIRQVVMNLLTNAIEAIEHRGGSITISTEAKYCDRDALKEPSPFQKLEPGSYVVLQIADTGSGMSQETLSKIFDPFYTTKFTGRGLGLAAVLGIVKAHHGAINIASELGVGTTVTVMLPAKGVAAGSTETEPVKREDERIVLIVDDDKRVLKVGERILSMAGYTVLKAEDGRMGLHVFRQRTDDIDVVLLDMTMPHLSGEEVFKVMHEVKPEIPVLLTSGYTSGDALGSFSGEAKPAGFIQKPYRPYELLKKIESLIGVHPNGRTSEELRPK